MIMIRCDENLYLYIKNCTNNALIEVKGFFLLRRRGLRLIFHLEVHGL